MRVNKDNTIHMCTLPEEHLTCEWEDVPEDVKAIIQTMPGLPCDGGGFPGRWCTSRIPGCPWYKHGTEKDYEEYKDEEQEYA